MAKYAAGAPDTGAATHLGDQLVNRYTLDRPPHPDSQWQSAQPEYRVPDSIEWASTTSFGAWQQATKSAHTPRKFGAGKNQIKPVPQDDFFEQIIIIPRSFNVGVVLGTIVVQIDVYNSYKREQRTWSNLVNGVDSGVIVTNAPSLPTTVEEQDGLLLTVNVLADGPVFITGDLDFVFDTITIPVSFTGQRARVFAHEPEAPLQEKLQFLTDVLEKKPGEEQRVSLRDVPRQVVDMQLQFEGRARQQVENLLHSGQGSVWGVPIWWEQTRVQAAIAINDTTITVEQTDYRDFRVGSFAMVWRDAFTFEALEIDSLTSTTITFTDGFATAFPVGVAVMPLRTGYTRPRIAGQRPPVNLQTMKIEFQIVDSDLDLSDASAFGTYNSKVLLDEPNLIINGRRLSENIGRRLTIIDSATGELAVFSDEQFSRRRHVKGFLSNSMQRLWEVRGLLHALRGRQTSFYLPTFFNDFTPVGSITTAGTTLDVENVGYATFVDGQQPRNVIQIRTTDGTKVTREITGASEISDDVERLTVDSAWGVDVTAAEMELVTIVEKVRMDSDEITITHRAQPGSADISMPVVGVFD